MRVISGEHRGIKLHSVPGKNTRPTSDKIKESLFNIIGQYFAGGKFLDLFAGSGGLGIEAISRGMDYGIFTEKRNAAIKTINQNVQKIRAEDKIKVYRKDAFKALNRFADEKYVFKLILIDPPYHFKDVHKYIDEIMEGNLIEEDGLIVYEHDSKVPAPIHNNLEKVREAMYGTTAITIYKKH